MHNKSLLLYTGYKVLASSKICFFSQKTSGPRFQKFKYFHNFFPIFQK
jgi:hypothetical protein